MMRFISLIVRTVICGVVFGRRGVLMQFISLILRTVICGVVFWAERSSDAFISLIVSTVICVVVLVWAGGSSDAIHFIDCACSNLRCSLSLGGDEFRCNSFHLFCLP